MSQKTQNRLVGLTMLLAPMVAWALIVLAQIGATINPETPIPACFGLGAEKILTALIAGIGIVALAPASALATLKVARGDRHGALPHGIVSMVAYVFILIISTLPRWGIDAYENYQMLLFSAAMGMAWLGAAFGLIFPEKLRGLPPPPNLLPPDMRR